MADVPSAEQLLRDIAWLRGLATALARDRDDADDLVQESWIAAWRRQPDDGRPMRAWLTKVVRDLAGMRRRGDRRRAAREGAVDDATAPAAPDELLEQMRLHRRLVDLVLELDEPYRSTVVAHFVEGRTSASVARSLGIPAVTVRKRLRVALSRLRAGLDAGAGDQKRWAPAVVAFAKGGMHVVKPTKPILAVLAALLLTSVTTVALLARRDSPDSARAGAGSSPSGVASMRRSTAVLGHGTAARVVVSVGDAIGPVAGAVIRCAFADGEVVVTRTDRDGTASIELAAGEWSVAASADGHEPYATVVRAEADHDASVSLVLATGGRMLRGVVTDVSGGPIDGARVDAARLDASTKPGRAVAVAFTGADGRYRLTVASGRVLVAASHAEYAAQTRYVDLGAGSAAADFALLPGGAIEGVVRDATTRMSVAGVAVRARPDAIAFGLAEPGERVVVTGDDGRFRVAGLSPGGYTLSARDATRGTRTPVRVALGVAEQQPGVVLLVAAGAAIRGTVVDDTVATAAAVAVHASNGFGEDRTATSDGAGRFAIDGLGPGRWMLRGLGAGYTAEGHALVELGASDAEGAVVRVRHALEIEGHVEPREVCEVSLAAVDNSEAWGTGADNQSVTTTEKGDFRFDRLAAGKATLTARCPNGDESGGEIVVAGGGAEHVVAVHPGASISGRVVDASGTPVAGVTVAAGIAGERDVTTIVNGVVTSDFTAVTSAQGVFEIRGLEAAGYRVSVLDRGRPMRVTKTVKVALAPAQQATGIEVVVQRPAGAIRGTALGPDGAALADAWVTLVQTPEDMLASVKASDDDGRAAVWVDGGAGDLPPALSDASGRFELTGIPPGRYQVIAEAQAGALRGRASDVAPDAEISIQLAPVGSLRGTVHGPQGPTSLFTVSIAGPTSASSSFTDGSFEFPRLDAGAYAITVTSSDGTGAGTARVTEGAASIDIALVANATVTGRLVDRAHRPVVGMSVALATDPGRVLLYDLPPTSGTDGRFQVTGPANDTLLVVLGQPPTFKAGLALEAGGTTDVGDVIVNER